MTDGDNNTINIEVCKNNVDAKFASKRTRIMAKEHFKFEFEEWMAEELIQRDDWKDWYEAMLEILPCGK